MGLLTNGLPEAIAIDGKPYRIRADYQTGVRLISIFEDRALVEMEKAMLLVELLYIDRPTNMQQAVEKGIRFLDCGEQPSAGEGTEQERRYSFRHDEKYIYSGVDRVLNGRLSRGEFVHWWEFCFAFMELPEDCTMSKILYYRTQHAKGKLTKEEQRLYAENKGIFELPEELTAQEEQAKIKFMELLGK